jgi:rubrerythrin
MDLRTFSEEELFLSAIRSEIDAKDVYSKLADGVKNAFLKDKLKFLAGEEEKHQRYLENTFSTRFAGKEIELPAKSFVPLPEIQFQNESVPISEVIESAMKAELAAQDFYKSFADSFDDSEIKKTLEFFATMELGHYKLLEIEKENIQKFEEYDDYWPMMHMGT